MKFVMATERDVSVGEEKERREKIVAEKYISEFYCKGQLLVWNRIELNETGGRG